MIKNIVKPSRNWLERHSKEVILRRSLGQSYPEIAQALGWNENTVKSRARREGLDRPISVGERKQLIGEVERDKVIEGLLDAVAGSPVYMRLRTCVEMLSETREQGPDAEAREAEKRKEIGEMSDAELRAYVAELVPGLARRTADEPGAKEFDGGPSVPADGAAGPETANAGGIVA